MILLFTTKKINNKDYIINSILETIDRNEEPQFESMAQPVASFYASESVSTTCTYPLNIKEQFPYWMRISNDGNSVLISLTEQYYKWLNCNVADINSVSFFRLEDLIDQEKIPNNLVEHLANTYLNALPTETIRQNYVSPEKVKQIIDNVKVNFYAKKGSPDSFKLLINTFFGVDPDLITVWYPKNYILRLNSGRYDWMATDSKGETSQTGDYPEFYPNSSGSFLNYSVINDNNKWQEYSYVVNTAGISLDAYYDTIKPLAHPAGTIDFFETKIDLFNTSIDPPQINYQITETTYLKNYALYTMGSTMTIGYTFGCSGAYGGVTGYPSYTFPSWDQEISAYYTPGISFGEININDFILGLTPIIGATSPNANLICS